MAHNSASAVRASFDELREIAFGSISSTYTLVGSAFEYSPRLIKIVNETDAGLYIAYDKVYAQGNLVQDTVSPGGAFVYDIGTNRSSQGGVLDIPKLNGIWIKDRGAAATSGSVYITVMYAL